MANPSHCANHPERETLVHCSSCGKPICTECMVYSPVGVKCRECARLPRSARGVLKPSRWAKAIGASAGSGTAAGFAYYFLLQGLGFFFFAFFVAIGIGYLVGEAVIRASGRYRGIETALIAVGGTIWAFVFPPLLTALVSLGMGWNAVVLSLSGRGIINWVIMAVAGYVAWQRNR